MLGAFIVSLSTEATERQSPGWGNSASNHNVITLVKVIEMCIDVVNVHRVHVYIYVKVNDLQQVT